MCSSTQDKDEAMSYVAYHVIDIIVCPFGSKHLCSLSTFNLLRTDNVECIFSRRNVHPFLWNTIHDAVVSTLNFTNLHNHYLGNQCISITWTPLNPKWIALTVLSARYPNKRVLARPFQKRQVLESSFVDGNRGKWKRQTHRSKKTNLFMVFTVPASTTDLSKDAYVTYKKFHSAMSSTCIMYADSLNDL